MVLGFVRRAVTAVMSCLLSCFQIKDSNIPNSQDPVVSRNKNAFSSLFIWNGNRSPHYKSIGKDEEDRASCEPDLMEVNDEAKFIEGCWTWPESPIVIQNSAEKWGDKSEKSGGGFFMKVSSRFSNTSSEKLKLDDKLSVESLSPVEVCEETVSGSDSLEDTPRRGSISPIQNRDTQNVSITVDVSSSETPAPVVYDPKVHLENKHVQFDCESDGSAFSSKSSSSGSDSQFSKQSGSSGISSDTQKVSTTVDVSGSETPAPVVFAPSVHLENKHVQFDCESDGSAFSSKNSSSGSDSQFSKQSSSSGSSSVSKLLCTSPFATPLKLTDEMQTPATVFPGYMSNTASGKATRFRSEYVYFDPNHETTLVSTPTSNMARKDLSVGKEINYEATLSSWLKPSSPEQNSDAIPICSFSGEYFHFGRTPGDKPILDKEAAHLNDEETSEISPTMWTGNGIPNTTSKYREDQRVSWHATPFEKRLEKALSDKTLHVKGTR